VHRSRIGVVLIDHPEKSYAQAQAYWSAAVGVEATQQGEGPYASLGRAGGLELALQRTGAGTPARVHLDVETDDVAAEVSRLSALGARVIAEPEGYVVLTDPGGLVFCVVPVQTGEEFDRAATTWP
jgi:hypothetical protein